MRAMPDPFKIELHNMHNGEVFDASNRTENWKDIQLELSREDVSGIIRNVVAPISFVLEARIWLKAVFDEHAHNSNVQLWLHKRNNSWTYDTPLIFQLDFTTYDESDIRIEIATRESFLFDYIKGKQSTKFDIPVSDVRNSYQWQFDRVRLDNTVDFAVYVPNGNSTWSQSEFTARTIGISFSDAEIGVKDIVEYQTVAYNRRYNWDDDWFMTKKDDSYPTIKMRLDIHGTQIMFLENNSTPVPGRMVVRIVQRWFDGEKNNIERTEEVFNREFNSYIGLNYIDFDIAETLTVNTHKGSKFYLLADYYPEWQSSASRSIALVGITGSVQVTYQGINETRYIDMVNPQTLLQELVNKLTSTHDQFPTTIEEFNQSEASQFMLVAGESIRRFQNARLHVSYKDFEDWMFIMGYEPEITFTELTFRPRGRVFVPEVVMELSRHECRDLRRQVDYEYLWTSIKIGYDSQDYSSAANSKYDYLNGAFTYTTDINHNRLESAIMSPYKASPYAIEYLAQQEIKKSTDQKDDNSIFVVHLNSNKVIPTSLYYLDEDTNEVYVNNTLFNKAITPNNLLMMNASLFGIACRQLNFAGADCYSDATLDGEAINQNYELPEEVKLFEPVRYVLETGHLQDLPRGKDVSGLIKFNYKGTIHQGYIFNIYKSETMPQEAKWVLQQYLYR